MKDYYKDCDDFSNLPQNKIKSVCAFCYFNGKFVIVKNMGNWQQVAGRVEPGEKPEDTLIREVIEETNMKVLKFFPLGYMYIDKWEDFQPRFLCLVGPYSPFEKDPAGEVTEIKFVDFVDIVKYVDPEDISNLTLDRCKKVLDGLKLEKTL